MGVGFLLQSGGLLPFLSVAENVALPARIAGRGRENGPALLEQLGLADVVNRRPSELSVGQRQRAALARAISTQPTLLLADEPTAALDSRNADTVMALIGAQISTGQIGAAVIATHDEGRARAYGFRTLSFDVGARPEGGLARLQSTRLAV
jgi:putative ABC transport system ATP-binding protein